MESVAELAPDTILGTIGDMSRVMGPNSRNCVLNTFLGKGVADKILEKSKETGAKLFEKGKEACKDLLNYIDEEL